MEPATLLIGFTLVIGLYMAWNIGANDVANAMGTSVGSGALTLKRAVVLAAIMEFFGVFFVGSHVTQTVQKGVVNPNVFSGNPYVLALGMIAVLLAAGTWLQIASYKGWPVSTTHSIIGALIGFGVVIGGPDAIYWDKLGAIFCTWIISPIMGGVISYIIFSFVSKRVLSSLRPMQSAIRYVPWLVFSFVASLATILLMKSFSYMSSSFKILAILVLPLIASSLVYLKLKIKSKIVEKEEPHPSLDPSLKRSLDKSLKHLSKTMQLTKGSIASRLEEIKNEVKSLKNSLIRPLSETRLDQEYASVEKTFAYLQILSASFMAFAHGANDVANAIGPISAVFHIIETGLVPSSGSHVSTWILLLGGGGIVLGLTTWGFRVIKTVGKGITELTPSRGFCAEFGAATTILLASKLGFPVSTTHTLIGSILGVGLARGLEAININTLKSIFNSWIITIPIGATLSVLYFSILKLIFATFTVS